MSSRKIIIGTVFSTMILERLKLIKLFRNWRIRSRTISRHSLVVSRSSIGDRSPRREVSRGHPAIVLHAWRTSSLYSSTMPAFYVRARSSTSNRTLFAQRNYRNTLSKQESIRRAWRPRSRTGRDGMPIANRARSLARSLDCDRIATRSEAKENVAWRG